MYIYKLDNAGKAKFYDYGITDGNTMLPVETESRANALIRNSRYTDWYIINSDEVPEVLERVIKGMRFDNDEDAEYFINGGGYVESILSRLEDLELVMAEVIGGIM